MAGECPLIVVKLLTYVTNPNKSEIITVGARTELVYWFRKSAKRLIPLRPPEFGYKKQ